MDEDRDEARASAVGRGWRSTSPWIVDCDAYDVYRRTRLVLMAARGKVADEFAVHFRKLVFSWSKEVPDAK